MTEEARATYDTLMAAITVARLMERLAGPDRAAWTCWRLRLRAGADRVEALTWSAERGRALVARFCAALHDRGEEDVAAEERAA